MYNVMFRQSVVYSKRIGHKTYQAIVNSATDKDSVVIGRHVAVLIATDGEGNSRKLIEQEFDEFEQAFSFLNSISDNIQ